MGIKGTGGVEHIDRRVDVNVGAKQLRNESRHVT